MGSVKPEIYGAQPPLEILRQFFDYGGWFQTVPVEFLRIIGVSVIATMGQPGGGLYGIPARLLRHFVVIHIPKYNGDQLLQIVRALMQQNFRGHEAPVRDEAENVAIAMLDVHRRCRDQLLPIPSKLHYIFNLRGIVKVLTGILLVQPSTITSDTGFFKLWHHEMMREFHDKFISYDDRKWFRTQMSDVFSRYLRVTWESVCPGGFNWYNTFADTSQRYKEVTVPAEQLLKICNSTLDEHNKDAQKPIDIVLFQEAIEHLSALSRVFTLERGHAMLVGVKSSGRKSLAALALDISSINRFDITITRSYGLNEWREDMKTLL
jgi:hypothetical protein